MAGATVQVRIEDQELKDVLSTLLGRMEDMTPVMKIIGDTVHASVVKNFEQGGRPTPWKPLAKSTLKRKKGGSILWNQGPAGGLLGSIHPTAYKDRVEVGTNKVYAAVHQFGAKKGAFGTVTVAGKTGKAGRSGATLYSHARTMPVPWGDIPARPFLMVQDEDWASIRDSVLAYLKS